MAVNPEQPSPEDAALDRLRATRLESDDEIQQALQAAAQLGLAPPPSPAPPPPSPAPPPPAQKVQAGSRRPPSADSTRQPKAPPPPPTERVPRPELPVARPPLALLCVLDDGKSDGEWVRLRADVTVIGRSEGDICIPHDAALSRKHAQIVRQPIPGGYAWSLVDLDSTNGTFLRASSIFLHDQAEVILGSTRYRFELPSSTVAKDETTVNETVALSDPAIQAQAATLVELLPTGPKERFPLLLSENWIGRDPKACAIARPNDALLNDRHALLFRSPAGHWHLKNNKSLNGIWIRITEPAPLKVNCQLRMGEQRFLFQVTP